MAVVDNAVYADGRRCQGPASLESTYELLRERSIEGDPCLAWIGLHQPDESEVTSVAAEFGLHELAVEDAVHVVERVDAFRQLLSNILTVNSTMVAQRQNEETTKLTQASLAQNEEVKRISSWAAIIFAPSMVGTVYGMNFTHMPELAWRFGYPMAISLMLLIGVLLYLLFRRRGWL